MRTWILKFLSSPTFEDEEKTRATNSVNGILIVISTGAILFFVFSMMAKEAGWVIKLLSLIILMTTVVLKVLLHRGHVYIVGVCLALIVWIVITVPMFVYDGLRDTAATGYYLVIAITGLVLSRRILLLFTLLSSLSYTTAYWVENSGIKITSFALPPTPIDLVTMLITLNMTALIVGSLVHGMKLIERSTRRERNKVQNYLDIAGAIILTLDTKGNVTVVNKKGCEVLGYKDNRGIVGKNWFYSFLPERKRIQVQTDFDRLLSGEIEALKFYENPILTKNGEERLIAWHNTLVRDEDGNVVGILSSGNDITEQIRAEKALRENEEKYRVLVNTAPFGIQLTDLDGRILFSNPAHHQLHGYDDGELVGKYIWDLVADEPNKSQTKEEYMKWTRERPPPTTRIGKDKTKDGRLIDVQINWDYIKDSRGELTGIVSIIRDITQRLQAEREIERRRLYLEGVLGAAPDAIVTMDASHRIIEWNLGAERLFGYTRDEVTGQNIDDLITASNVVKEAVSLTKIVMSREDILPTETIRYRKDGSAVDVILASSPILVEGEFAGAVAVYTDISERKQMERQLAHLATHDTLTNLPNRALFQDRMEHALKRSARNRNRIVEKWEIAIVMIDLDDFKPVNDTLGHATGDLLLQAVAQRLEKQIRKTDTVARMGGDEFTLIFENLSGERDAKVVAEKILATFFQPFDLGEHIVKVEASIGISLYPQDGEDFEILFKRADEAMYEAKLSGNTYRFYWASKG